jgi:hypothetical protein
LCLAVAVSWALHARRCDVSRRAACADLTNAAFATNVATTANLGAAAVYSGVASLRCAALAVADFNGDGLTDVFVRRQTTTGGGSTSVLLLNKSPTAGKFAATLWNTVTNGEIAVADWDLGECSCCSAFRSRFEVASVSGVAVGVGVGVCLCLLSLCVAL